MFVVGEVFWWLVAEFRSRVIRLGISVGFIDWYVDVVGLGGIVCLCYWPDGLRKFVVLLECGDYKFSCLVNVLSRGLVGDPSSV